MNYVVLSFLCAIAVITYIQRLGMQTAYEPIQADLRIDTEQFGAIGTAWLIGYAIMQVPSGWLADRWGSRNALVLYAILWSILTGVIGLCPTYEAVLVVWFCMGMALAGVFPCAAKSIAAWFPDTQRAMASGMIGSFTLLGAAIASLLTTWLLAKQQWSWQAIYGLYGALGVAWAVAYFCLIPEGKRGTLTLAKAPPMTSADLWRLVTSVPMWLICGQQFFRAAGMTFFFYWFPKFLREAREFSKEDAGLATSYAIGAGMVGGILGGFFSDWLLRRTGLRRLSRQGIAVVGMSSCAVLIFTTYHVEDADLVIMLFSLGTFVAAFGGVSGYTVTIELGGTRVATVFSIMNMSGNFGSALFNFIAGALKERTGGWDIPLFVFAGIFAVDAVCWALLNPPSPFRGEP